MSGFVSHPVGEIAAGLDENRRSSRCDKAKLERDLVVTLRQPKWGCEIEFVCYGSGEIRGAIVARRGDDTQRN